ncbi:MAG: exodeoxyribonuclease VII small subunit [Clostridia bacterium]
MAAKTVKKEPSFEDGLGRLEALAEKMEQSELPLDDLLKLYEEGIALSAQLKQKLESAQGRMKAIRQGMDGKPVSESVELTQQPSMLDGLTPEE